MLSQSLNPCPWRGSAWAWVSTRFFIDTGIQIFMPFLPVIAAGLGVDIITMGRLVSLRSATGLMAPLFGVMADRRGYRTVMRLGLMLNAVGFLLIGLSVNLPMAVVGMLLTGMGTFAFLPSIQAYVSARLPYAIRGRGLGILEYAWALSGIGGLFLAGLLIAATSWRVPFYLLSASMFFFASPSGACPPWWCERHNLLPLPQRHRRRPDHCRSIDCGALQIWARSMARPGPMCWPPG